MTVEPLRFFFSVLASCIITLGCTPPQNPAARQLQEQEIQRVKNIFTAIDERNRTVKKSREWLQEAYSGIKIRA